MNVSGSPAAAAVPRGRLQLILLATLFFFPLLGSYALYFLFPDLRPSGTVNYGELVLPTQTLPELRFVDAKGEPASTETLRGRWTYVVLADQDCGEPCEQALVMTRQVRASTNEKRSRVQRILVLSQGADAAAVAARLAPEHPDLRVLRETSEPRLSGVLQQAPAAIYLLDPLANWVMRYPAGGSIEQDFKGLKKDLGKLLRASQIG